MIARWLQRKIYTTTDPERVLIFCAMFGAYVNLGPIGTIKLVWKVYKKRKKGEKKNAGKK